MLTVNVVGVNVTHAVGVKSFSTLMILYINGECGVVTKERPR